MINLFFGVSTTMQLAQISTAAGKKNHQVKELTYNLNCAGIEIRLRYSQLCSSEGN